MKTAKCAFLILMLAALGVLRLPLQFTNNYTNAQGTERGEYFRIFAELRDDPVFITILGETNLQDVFLKNYQMVVNTGDKVPFVVIGEFGSPDVEQDPKAFRYDWLFFSQPVRDKLLLYKKKIMLH